MMISVIVTTYNRPDSLKNCIKHITSIEDYNYITEIIVVDDCSNINLATKNKLICNDHKKIKYIFNTNNKGLAESRNIGVSNTFGDFVFFLDDDILVQEKYFLNQYTILKRKNCVTIGNISFPEYPMKSNNLMKYVNSRYLGSHTYSSTVNEILNPANFAGGISGFTKEMFINTGGFPSNFKFYGGEDIFFGFNLLRYNIKILFINDSCAIHDDDVSFERYKQKQMTWAAIGYRIIINKFPEIEKYTAYRYLSPIKSSDSFSIKIKKCLLSILFIKPIISFTEKLLKISYKQPFFYNSLQYRYIFASWFWLGIRNNGTVFNVNYESK